MIGFEKVAVVYAEALLAAAVDAGPVTELEEDIAQLNDLFHKDPDVWAFFKSPIIEVDGKLSLLSKTLKGKVSDTLYSFLCVLCVRRRFELFPDIVEQVKTLLDHHLKRKRVQVFSAVALTPEHSAELQGALKKRLNMDVVLEVHEKPDLIGGLVVRTGDLKEDSSIKDSLARMAKALTGKRILGEKYYA
jgi:F-type H+-transporting ATPase subunit delta